MEAMVLKQPLFPSNSCNWRLPNHVNWRHINNTGPWACQFGSNHLSIGDWFALSAGQTYCPQVYWFNTSLLFRHSWTTCLLCFLTFSESPHALEWLQIPCPPSFPVSIFFPGNTLARAVLNDFIYLFFRVFRQVNHLYIAYVVSSEDRGAQLQTCLAVFTFTKINNRDLHNQTICSRKSKIKTRPIFAL
jgi:hypothetical protein